MKTQHSTTGFAETLESALHSCPKRAKWQFLRQHGLIRIAQYFNSCLDRMSFCATGLSKYKLSMPYLIRRITVCTYDEPACSLS